jgi:DNA-binding protein Fis
MTATGFSKRYQKYQSGQFSLAELFTPAKRAHFHPDKALTYQGETFGNYQEAAKSVGISQTTFYRRLKKYRTNQITLDELFSATKYRSYELPPYHEKIFANKTEAAQYVGISLTQFSKRLKQYYEGAYTINDLYSRNSSNLRAKSLGTVKLHYQGITFNSYKAAYDYIGISSTAFKGRLKKYLAGDFTIEQLFRFPKHSQGYMIKYQRHTFYSYQEAAEFIGISYNAFNKRLKKYKTGQIMLAELFQPKQS